MSRHLGAFADLVAVAGPLFEARRRLTPDAVRALLAFDPGADPIEPRVDGAWSRDGVDGEGVSWSVGYGPRTRAWILRPSGAREPLPGALALHGHDAFKFLGKEKVADGPSGPALEVADLRREMYEGRAFANELARRGFAVLAHDAFLWGSRRFDPASMPASTPIAPEDQWLAADDRHAEPGDYRHYNRLAQAHEHLIAKYCVLLGTSLAGVVAHEDRVAAAYLRSRPDVAPGPLAAVGLSGGGCRTALLNATCDDIGAAAIVGMMSTHAALLDRHVANHTWMFFPPGLSRLGDWPDLAACRAPSPLLVQYCRDDQLFPLAGMEAAHRRLTELYDASDSYVGRFHPGPHRFDRAMQDEAFEFLRRA